MQLTIQISIVVLCMSAVTAAQSCGNGIIEASEQCDDGNRERGKNK